VELSRPGQAVEVKQNHANVYVRQGIVDLSPPT